MYENYVELIKNTLSEYRYNHSICVADRARELAKKHGADENKAYLAGILHDITKEMPDTEQIKLIEKYDRPLTYIEKGNLDKKFRHRRRRNCKRNPLPHDGAREYDAV